MMLRAKMDVIESDCLTPPPIDDPLLHPSPPRYKNLEDL